MKFVLIGLIIVTLFCCSSIKSKIFDNEALCSVKITKREIVESIPIEKCRIVGNIYDKCSDIGEGSYYAIKIFRKDFKNITGRKFYDVNFFYEIDAGIMAIEWHSFNKVKTDTISVKSQEQITFEVKMDCVWTD